MRRVAGFRQLPNFILEVSDRKYQSTHFGSITKCDLLMFPEQAPSLTSVFREQTIRPGNFISLKCVASGDPLPTISWRLDGFWKLENGPRIRIRSFETQIPGEVVSFLNVSLVEVSGPPSGEDRLQNDDEHE